MARPRAKSPSGWPARLSKLREERGLSAKELAKEAAKIAGRNITDEAINSYERGKIKNPATSIFLAICRVLDVDAVDLFYGPRK